MRKLGWIVLLSVFLFPFSLSGQAQEESTKPFILPVAVPPSPSTWLVGQPYGNTTGAFNFGTAWYSAGQGLHFGLDISMPCGTELVAMADGEVLAVDAGNFGSAPHNLILIHRDLNLSVLYGHLLERPNLISGQPVQQGEVVALSGDPDSVCTSRPHLHLEVRSLDYRTAYNPLDYIDANWHSLFLIGPFANPMFQQDMDNARRWMHLDDQPPVAFGGRILNNYASAWPYPLDVRPPVNTPLRRDLGELPAETSWRTLPIGFGGCCSGAWWHPTDSNKFYVIDGLENQRASVFEYSTDGSTAPTLIEEAPPMLLSPDGTIQVTRVNGQVTIRRLADLTEWTVATQGFLPAVNADNTQLLWEVWKGSYLPGESAQTVEIWVSNLDGSNARIVWTQAGGWSVWLDETRLLIVSPRVDDTRTTLTIFDTRDNSSYELGTWEWLRGLDVAPGGGRLMFYLTFQADMANDGIYTLETQAGAQAQKLPFFGGWQWRDAHSVYYIPFDPTTSQHILAYYHLPTGENRYLTDSTTTPFTIANADWAVASDGNKIVFMQAGDKNMWLLAAE